MAKKLKRRFRLIIDCLEDKGEGAVKIQVKTKEPVRVYEILGVLRVAEIDLLDSEYIFEREKKE